MKAPTFLDRLASRIGERVHLLDVADVTHVVARERAVYAMAGGKEHLLDGTRPSWSAASIPRGFSASIAVPS